MLGDSSGSELIKYFAAPAVKRFLVACRNGVQRCFERQRASTKTQTELEWL